MSFILLGKKKIFGLTHLENNDELERFCKLDILGFLSFGQHLEYLQFSLKQLVSGLFDKLKMARLMSTNMTVK